MEIGLVKFAAAVPGDRDPIPPFVVTVLIGQQADSARGMGETRPVVHLAKEGYALSLQSPAPPAQSRRGLFVVGVVLGAFAVVGLTLIATGLLTGFIKVGEDDVENSAVASTAASTSTAEGGSAAPDTVTASERAYLDELRVTMPAQLGQLGDDKALKIGHDTCDAAASIETVDDLGNYGFTVIAAGEGVLDAGNAGGVIGAALNALCPEHKERIMGSP